MDTQKNLSILCQKYFTVSSKERGQKIIIICLHAKHKGRQRLQTVCLEFRLNKVTKIRTSALLALLVSYVLYIPL